MQSLVGPGFRDLDFVRAEVSCSEICKDPCIKAGWLGVEVDALAIEMVASLNMRTQV